MMDSGKQTILVVDDEKMIRVMASRVLGKFYNVVEASDGESGLAVLNKEKPSLILLDIFMPKINGYTFLGNINEQVKNRKISVIMISAIDHTLNKTLGRVMGAREYLSKPFTPQELLTTVNRYVPYG